MDISASHFRLNTDLTIEEKEVRVLDEYADKIDFRDGVANKAYKYGKICTTNLVFSVLSDIVFPTEPNWYPFMKLPYPPYGASLYFPPIETADGLYAPLIAANGDVCFWGGDRFRQGSYVLNWSYICAD